MKKTRAYKMTARAEAVGATRRRILEALFDLACERPLPEISLDDVAARSGVSVQTVLRQFGSRAELIDAYMDYAISRVTEERRAPSGDVDAAMKVLLDHYEERGRVALLFLAQEGDPQVGKLTERGRQVHRDWVAAVFAPFEPDPETMNLLIVATDVYTWKLLRQDRRLSRRATQLHMTRLVHGVLDGKHT